MEVLELVRKAQQGDHSAFGLLFEMFSDKIYRFISYKISAIEEREDILQEVFVKVWKGLSGLKLDQLNFQAWIYRITLNTINDYYRKQYRQPEPVELKEDAASKFDNSGYDESLMVAKVFAQLKPEYKEVLDLRYIEGLELEEIAGVLGKTNLAVRILIHRALKQSRLILKDYDI